MKKRHWFFLFVISFIFLISSFFFFTGSVLSLISGSHRFEDSGDIAIVEVLGPIWDSKDTCEEIRDLKDNREAKAVILRVDSPGGSVGASQEIFECVKILKETKPVIASMGSVAASGGYYALIAANKIVANPGTITGSIGVRMELLNAQRLFEWARLQPITLKSGRLKDAGSSARSLTSEEKSYFEGVLKDLHLQFKKALQEGRSLTQKQVEALADGRVFTGIEAKEKGLVDELGSLEAAIRIAKDMAGIKGKPEIYYPAGRRQHFFEKILGSFFEKVTQKVLQLFFEPVFLFQGGF